MIALTLETTDQGLDSESLADIGSDLKTTSDNLEMIESEIRLIATEIRRKVVSQYRASIAEMRARTERYS